MIIMVIIVMVIVMEITRMIAVTPVFIDFTAGQKRRRHHPKKNEKNWQSSSHDWVSFVKKSS